MAPEITRAQQTKHPVLTHFLLTKFNLPISYSTRAGQHADDRWMADRWHLFETHCLPSVLAQSNPDFTWVIFCWDQTSDTYRRKLDAVAQANEHVVIAYLATSTQGEHLADVARDRGLVFGPHLLTSRIDNDDAMATDYVNRVQVAARKELARSAPRIPHVWNLPIGYQLSNGRRYVHFEPQGPFVSLLENSTTADNASTVLSLSHRDIKNTFARTQLWSRPAWLQVVHEDNLANHLQGVRSLLRKAPQQFPALGSQPVDEPVLVVLKDSATSASRVVHRYTRIVVRRARSKLPV